MRKSYWIMLVYSWFMVTVGIGLQQFFTSLDLIRWLGLVFCVAIVSDVMVMILFYIFKKQNHKPLSIKIEMPKMSDVFDMPTSHVNCRCAEDIEKDRRYLSQKNILNSDMILVTRS